MKFFAGRLSIGEKPQTTIFADHNRPTAYDVVLRAFSSGFQFETSRNIVIFHEPLFHNDVYVGGKLGRQTEASESTFDQEEKVFIERSQTTAPYVFYAYIKSQQIFLIEKRSTVFRDPSSALRYIEEYINSQSDGNHVAAVKPITSQGLFWRSLDTASSLVEVTLTFRMPNFLGKYFTSTRDLLSSVHEETSAQEFETSYRSESGGVKVPRNNAFENAINWIEGGGGEWRLRGKFDGRPKRIRSGEHIQIFTANIDRTDITPEILADIESHISPAITTLIGSDNNDS